MIYDYFYKVQEPIQEIPNYASHVYNYVQMINTYDLYNAKLYMEYALQFMICFSFIFLV